MQNNFTNNRSIVVQSLKQKYNYARNNLLLVILFTTVNLVLLITNSYTYFLFSASIPYQLTNLGMYFCGMYPSEYYEDFQVFPPAVFYVMLAVSVVIVLLYLVSFFLSKNNKVGWLIFALVFFSLDTVEMFLFYGFALEMILDIVFHVWVIVILAMGIHAHYKLKELPPEPQTETTDGFAPADGSYAPAIDVFDSPILRKADLETKSRTLLEFEAFGHKVVYRRMKKVNELVIDGNVYAEYVALMEKTHALSANIDGHEIAVGLNGSISYGAIDGQIVARKTRLY